MKKLFITTILLAFASFAVAETKATNDHHSSAMEWTIDNAHSNILFQINHFFNPIPGTFSDFGGKIVFDPENAEASEIDVAIQVASIDTDVDRRDEHLRSEDFFGAETYPEMHFRSTDVRHVEGTSYVALGQLTIKDVTREVELPFEFLGVRDHLMQEDVLVAGLHGEIAINRNDFGVGVGDWASTAVVANEVRIQISLQVNKDK